MRFAFVVTWRSRAITFDGRDWQFSEEEEMVQGVMGKMKCRSFLLLLLTINLHAANRHDIPIIGTESDWMK
jgi:hypothetical protein